MSSAVQWAALALSIVVARPTVVAMERTGDYVDFGSDSSRRLQARKKSTSFRSINGQTSASIDRLTSMFPGGTEILLSLTWTWGADNDSAFLFRCWCCCCWHYFKKFYESKGIRVESTGVWELWSETTGTKRACSLLITVLMLHRACNARVNSGFPPSWESCRHILAFRPRRCCKWKIRARHQPSKSWVCAGSGYQTGKLCRPGHAQRTVSLPDPTFWWLLGHLGDWAKVKPSGGNHRLPSRPSAMRGHQPLFTRTYLVAVRDKRENKVWQSGALVVSSKSVSSKHPA